MEDGATGTADIGLYAIELAAVRGWPALESESIDGWLARSSSGGSVRANTVSALAYSGHDLEASIDRVIAFYRSRGAVPRLTITGIDQPAGLDDALAARGFVRDGDHLTLAKGLGTPVPGMPAPVGSPSRAASVAVARRAAPTSGWMQVYLSGLSESRRAAAPLIVDRVPRPCAFFEGSCDGAVMASGLSVVDGHLASVQCMATLPSARRSGGAGAILAAIEAYAREAGCRQLYLQADADNAVALALYRRFGFAVAGRYHVRALD